MTRRRLDRELVRRGLIADVAEAREAVGAGRVLVSGSTANSAASMVSSDQPVALVEADGPRFVSRGGEKLDAALTRFAIDPTGTDCLDAGSSTGGFTDRLLRAGAARVIAVDVGYGQLAWPLRVDERVTVMERVNVRDLTPPELPFAPALVVADLSFISLRTVIASLASLAAPGATFVLLVKPQFEARAQDVEPGGVVRDHGVWRDVLLDVADACTGASVFPVDVMASPLRGPAGNVEFLLRARSAAEGAGLVDGDLDAAIDEGAKVTR